MFSEVIVLEVLEARGYMSPSMTRTTRHCRWYQVRKNDQLFEVEAYDSTLCNTEAMTKYLSSLRNRSSGTPFLREISDIIIDRDITLVIRPKINGEPLYAVFLRPGALSVAEAGDVIRSFEPVHKYLLKNPMENFSPLAVLLYLQYEPERGVTLDSLRCGPWINHFEQISVIYNYLKPDLDWQGQVNWFRNSMIQKLYLGKPKPLSDNIPDDFEGARAAKELLAGAMKNPETYQLELSALEKKYRPRKKGSVLRGLVFAVIIGLPLVAFLIRQLQSGSFWQGAAQNNDEAAAAAGVEEDFAFDPESDESVKVGHSFMRKIREVEKLMAGGDFAAAFGEISAISKMNLRPGETKMLSALKVSYPERKDADFSSAMERAQQYLTQNEFDLASAVMDDIVSRYGEGEKTDEAKKLSSRIASLKDNFFREEKERLNRLDKSLVKDRLLIERIEKMHFAGMRTPVRDLPALNKSLEVARLDLATKPAHYLLDCYILMNEGEAALYRQMLDITNKAQLTVLYEKLQSYIPDLVSSEVYEISEKGIEYRNSAGGGSFRYANVPPARLYNIFKETSASDATKAGYHLYLFCIKYKLTSLAENEKKNIKSPVLLQKADSLRDIDTARKDLFTDQN